MNDDITALRRDIIKLASALSILNRYTHRLPMVEGIVASITKPSPEIVAAEESLAQMLAAIPRMGKIISITAEWDENWQFVFSFRTSSGYQIADGFDLREGTPGLQALQTVLVSASIGEGEFDISPAISQPAAGTVNRRIVYPKEVVDAKA